MVVVKDVLKLVGIMSRNGSLSCLGQGGGTTLWTSGRLRQTPGMKWSSPINSVFFCGRFGTFSSPHHIFFFSVWTLVWSENIWTVERKKKKKKQKTIKGLVCDKHEFYCNCSSEEHRCYVWSVLMLVILLSRHAAGGPLTASGWFFKPL